MQFKSILATTSVLILTAASQGGATFTWTGADLVQPTAWLDRDNWDQGGPVPGATDDVIIPNVTNDPVLGSDVTVASITIQSGGVLTIDAPSAIADVFTTSLNVQNGGTLALAADADLTVTGSAGFDLDSGGAITLASGGVLEVSGTGTHAVDGGITLSGTFIYSAASGTFDLNAAWSVAGIFDFTGAATLQLDAVMTVPSGGNLNLTSTGTLDVNVSNGLTLTGDMTFSGTGPATVDIANGAAFLMSNAGTADLNVDESATFTYTGTGKFDSQHASNEIIIANGEQLTMNPPLVGAVTITNPSGTSTFNNVTSVTATGAISLGANVALTGSGAWQTAAGSITFNRQHTGGSSLSSNFLVEGCGTMFFPASVTTSGSLTYGGASNGGTINVGPGTFCHNTSTCITTDTTVNCS